jgi:hypothetical protein
MRLTLLAAGLLAMAALAPPPIYDAPGPDHDPPRITQPALALHAAIDIDRAILDEGAGELASQPLAVIERAPLDQAPAPALPELAAWPAPPPRRPRALALYPSIYYSPSTPNEARPAGDRVLNC